MTQEYRIFAGKFSPLIVYVNNDVAAYFCVSKLEAVKCKGTLRARLHQHKRTLDARRND